MFTIKIQLYKNSQDKFKERIYKKDICNSNRNYSMPEEVKTLDDVKKDVLNRAGLSSDYYNQINLFSKEYQIESLNMNDIMRIGKNRVPGKEFVVVVVGKQEYPDMVNKLSYRCNQLNRVRLEAQRVPARRASARRASARRASARSPPRAHATAETLALARTAYSAQAPAPAPAQAQAPAPVPAPAPAPAPVPVPAPATARPPSPPSAAAATAATKAGQVAAEAAAAAGSPEPAQELAALQQAQAQQQAHAQAQELAALQQAQAQQQAHAQAQAAAQAAQAAQAPLSISLDSSQLNISLFKNRRLVIGSAVDACLNGDIGEQCEPEDEGKEGEGGIKETSGTIIHRTTSGGNVVETHSTIEKYNGTVSNSKTIGDIYDEGVIVYIDNTPKSEFYLIETNLDKWLLYCRSMIRIHRRNRENSEEYHIKEWVYDKVYRGEYTDVTVKDMFKTSEEDLKT